MTSSDPPPSSGDQPYPYDPYAGYQGQQYPQPLPYGGAYPPPMPPAPYGYGYVPHSQSMQNQAIGALVTNVAVTMLCCPPLGIAGIVVSAVAMGRVDTQPDSARNLLKWGWGLAIASGALAVVLGVIYAVVLIGSLTLPS